MTGCYQDPDSGLCYPWQVMLSFPDGTTYRYTQGNILQTYTVSGAASTGTLYYMPTRWTLRLSDKTYNYSKAGYLQSIRNNFGDGSLNFTYSSTDPSKLVRVTNGVGQRVEYVWTGDRVTQVTDPAGRIWRYSYDSNGRLMKASSPGAAPDIRTYHYESTAGNFLLTGISINGSRYSTYKYFPDGRVQESGLTGGEEVNAFEYGPFQTVVRDAFGQATTYSFVSIGGELRVSWVSRALTTTCGAAAAETRYDANGYIATTFDWKRLRSDFNYDALGRLTFQSGASVSPRGSSIGYTWDGVYIIEKRWLDDNYIVYAKVNYNYFAGITSDVKGRLSSEVWTDVRTSAQRTTNYRYSYHPSQAIASIVVAVAIPGGTAVTTTSYDTQGNVVSVINPLGQQTTSAN